MEMLRICKQINLNVYYRGQATWFIDELVRRLRVNVLAVEYPGYGIYTGYETTQELIEEDAECVYNYVQLELKVPDNKILVYGRLECIIANFARSIGSGPSCYVCTKYNPKALILMSPFSSIRNVAKEHVSVLAYFLKSLQDKFNNQVRATQIECPCLIIHGKSDTLIPYQQAFNGIKILHSLGSKRKSHWFPEKMTHNEFDYYDDLEEPILNFLELLDQLDSLSIK